MLHCEVELPETVASALGFVKGHESKRKKKELAAYFFQREILSFGQARELSGLSIWAFLDFLRERKIPLHYDEADFEEDLETIKGLTD